jgi:hypothetical protein
MVTELFVNDALHTFFHNRTLASNRRAAHYPSFVIEVTQDNKNSSTLQTKGILNWYFDVIESYKRGTSCGGIAGLNGLSLYAFATLDKDYSESILCLATNREAGYAALDQIISKTDNLTSLRKFHL